MESVWRQRTAARSHASAILVLKIRTARFNIVQRVVMVTHATDMEHAWTTPSVSARVVTVVLAVMKSAAPLMIAVVVVRVM